jgi:hypothetical protein
MHVSEDTVDVTGGMVISELPFLELFNHFVGEAQFSLALIAIFVQIFTGRDLEVGVCLNNKHVLIIVTFHTRLFYELLILTTAIKAKIMNNFIFLITLLE